jgi:lipoprotein-anchoring transpeptidase ErfK/SrfK
MPRIVPTVTLDPDGTLTPGAIEVPTTPRQDNEDAAVQQLLDARQAARDRITAAQAARQASADAKAMPFTTVAEGRAAFRALADVANTLARLVVDTNQAQLRTLRYVLGDFDTPPE